MSAIVRWWRWLVVAAAVVLVVAVLVWQPGTEADDWNPFETDPELTCNEVSLQVAADIKELGLRGEAAQSYWDTYAPDC